MSYKKLAARFTAEELAEAYVFPIELSQQEKAEAAAQLAIAREKSQKEMSESTRLGLKILQLKFQLEDYIQSKEYKTDKNFGRFLERYVDLVHGKRKDFAEEISIDESLLSQFINQHRLPPDYIIIRLEIHSNNAIPATYWYKLIEKQREYELRTDKEIRKRERKFVHRKVSVTNKSR